MKIVTYAIDEERIISLEIQPSGIRCNVFGFLFHQHSRDYHSKKTAEQIEGYMINENCSNKNGSSFIVIVQYL